MGAWPRTWSINIHIRVHVWLHISPQLQVYSIPYRREKLRLTLSTPAHFEMLQEFERKIIENI